MMSSTDLRVVFLAHAPDAEPEKHRCVIETPKYYKLFIVLVKDQNQADDVYKRLVEEEDIHSILFCPGFMHRDLAEITEAVGGNVAVAVARGDGPSSKVSAEVRGGRLLRKRKGERGRPEMNCPG